MARRKQSMRQSMTRKVIAIIGSYRKGGTVDTLADAVLAGAREHGAETSKIYLVDQHIEYCRNCRQCTQEESPVRGECAIHDDMLAVLTEIHRADAVVLGSPVNFYNVTAVFRTFLERLLGCCYWPWGQAAPRPRSKALPRKAVLIASSAAPGFLLPLFTGASRVLHLAANCLGARPVAKFWIGLAAQSATPHLSPNLLRRARRVGTEL
jgi:NAD(P)H-dependent FMN reductase